ncbi:MAG: hypothetical protein RQM95_12195 [Syntrophaceticus schinkii]
MNLKQSRRKDGRVYLSIEKAYRDKATGKPRAKTIKSLGYLDVLEKDMMTLLPISKKLLADDGRGKSGEEVIFVGRYG